MSETLETFNDLTPIEPSTAVNDISKREMDTFDNLEPIIPENEEKEVQPLKNSQVNLLDDKDDKSEKKVEAKEEKKEEEEEEEGKEKIEDKEVLPKEEVEKKDSPKKVIKGKLGEDVYELDPNTEIKVPVKGVKETVTLQQLMNDYSGGKNWDREYTKLGEEKTQFKKELDSYKTEFNWLKGHLDTVGNMLDEDGSNPIDALMYFLDVTGRDPVEYQQKIFDSQLDLLRTLDDMDSVEKELFWERRKNESLLKRQKTVAGRQQAERVKNQTLAKVNELRQTYNVSEEQYFEAHKELVDLGIDQLTPEKVVEYAVKLPFIIKAEGLIDKYISEIDSEKVGNLVSDVTDSLLSGVTEEEIQELLQEIYGQDEDLFELNKKVLSPKKVTDSREDSRRLKYKASEDENHIETFDDFFN